LVVLSEAEKSILEDDSIEKELLVKVSPPLYIQVIPPPPSSPVSSNNANANGNTNTNAFSSSRTATSDFVENFMSTWTRLVGDPVLSKWIIMVLAVSVSLNGYLLKGIAAGLAGKGVSGKECVRFVAAPVDETTTKSEKGIEADRPVVTTAVAPARSTVSPVPTRAAKFMLEGLDQRFKAQGLALRTPSSSDSSDDGEQPSLSASTTESSSSSSSSSSSVAVRSLAECVDIFENGPRPVSVSLSLLNDEEVVMLAQSGKIAAYALEKLLDNGLMDNGKLERAVRIRRALICEWFFFSRLVLF
jgi:hydroxymethylglutaryl-CoA reductase (NADPH)